MERLGYKSINLSEFKKLIVNQKVEFKNLKGQNSKKFNAKGTLIKDSKYGYKIELDFGK